MSKVTSKLQLTVPKTIADQYGIRPGDELQWVPAGDAIRVVAQKPTSRQQELRSVEERLRLFDEMIERQRRRERNSRGRKNAADFPGQTHARKPQGTTRGWSREELYTRGRAR